MAGASALRQKPRSSRPECFRPAVFFAPHEGRCRHERMIFASFFAQGCATHERQFPIQLRRRPLSGAVPSGVFDKTRSSQVLCTFIAPSGQNS